MLIVLFGMDGTGKSTHGKSICKNLHRLGLECVYYHLHKYLVPPTEIFSEKQINRWKPVLRLWPLIAWMDNQIHYRLRMHGINAESVIVADRYFYDKVANFLFYGLCGRHWARIYLRLLPKPDLVFFLDAPATVAFERKSEHSVLEFEKLKEIYTWISGQVTPSPSHIQTQASPREVEHIIISEVKRHMGL